MGYHSKFIFARIMPLFGLRTFSEFFISKVKREQRSYIKDKKQLYSRALATACGALVIEYCTNILDPRSHQFSSVSSYSTPAKPT